MSDLAFECFEKAGLLTIDELRDKAEIINLTEEVLDAKGIECDAKILKLSEDKLKEILEVRRKRKKSKIVISEIDDDSIEENEQHDNKEAVYAT
jgi:hypothetical protein